MYKDTKEDSSIVEEAIMSYGTNMQALGYQLIDYIKHGIPFKKFTALVSKSPFNMSDWASYLHITERTILRYKTEEKTFETLQSEKIVELEKLINFGYEVFGTKQKFESWCNHSSASLNNHTPKSLLDTSTGIQLVMQELGRIEHGILA
jgi:putative toxin-antitoxin system antitoxin component (TIGR02293 family)